MALVDGMSSQSFVYRSAFFIVFIYIYISYRWQCFMLLYSFRASWASLKMVSHLFIYILSFLIDSIILD